MTIPFHVYTFHFLYNSCGCSSKGLTAIEKLLVSVSTTSKREGNGGHTWRKNPKMALISDYLAAASSPDTSADALAIINIGYLLFIHCRPNFEGIFEGPFFFNNLAQLFLHVA